MTEPLYRGSTTITNGLNDGETFSRSTIGVSGDIAKLSIFEPARGRFVELDMIRDFTVIERGDTVAFDGVSRQGVEEIGLDADEARVKWTITLKGCQQC